MILTLVLSTGIVTTAKSGPIVVDEPVVCMSVDGARSAVRYFIEGSFELMHEWVDEPITDCFRLGAVPVPSAVTENLVPVFRRPKATYGYIPFTIMGREFYLFFIRVQAKLYRA